MRKLGEHLGPWVSLILSSMFFGLIHILNPKASIASSIAITLTAGVVLGLLYLLSENLWLPIGLHVAWNFVQGGIFGIPGSGKSQKGLLESKLVGTDLITGGKFGPEASIVTIMLFTFVNLYLLRQVLLKRIEGNTKEFVEVTDEAI